MRRISISHEGSSRYHVAVEDDASRTEHDVTVWPSDVERYAPGWSPEELLEASFEFLLEREPKEAILRQFELPAIESYFPEFRSAIMRSRED